MSRRHGWVTNQWYICRVTKVVDGDTIDVRDIYGHEDIRGDVRIRIHGIDAPEINQAPAGGRTAAWRAESHPGHQAKAWLIQLLESRVCMVRPCLAWTDPYGRIIAQVRSQGRDISTEMLKSGYAKRWLKKKARMLKEVLAQRSTEAAPPQDTVE